MIGEAQIMSEDMGLRERFRGPDGLVTTIETDRLVVIRAGSWRAIFAGTVVGLAFHLTFTLLGAGIGLVSMAPAIDAAALPRFDFGAALWWVVSGVLAMFLGGWVAGRWCPTSHRVDSTLHGVLAWCVSALVGAILTLTVAPTVLAWSLTPISRGLAVYNFSIADAAAREAAADALGAASLTTALGMLIGMAAAGAGAFLAARVCLPRSLRPR